jgi:chromosome partitioning protein
MLTVAVTNQKGGVGKSAIAVCLAGALVDKGKKVLLIDLEPQATATEWLGARSAADLEHAQSALVDDYGPALLGALLEGKALPAYETRSGVFLVPSGNALNAFEIEAARLTPGKRELLLRASLEQLPKLWDFVLIDCPPSLGLTTINALAAADRTLMPVKLDSASRTPLVRLFRASQEVQQQFNPKLDLLGVLGTFYKKQVNHSADMLEWLQTTFGPAGDDLVFRTVIRELTHVGESHGHQQPVTQYVKSAGLRGSRAAKDFQDLADEFLERAEFAIKELALVPNIQPEEPIANA